MKTTRRSARLVCALLLTCLLSWSGQAAEKIRLLVVTGGHDFQTNQFFELFRHDPGLTFEAVTHPNAHPRWRPEAAQAFDVLVLYDMWQKISEPAKADLVNLLKSGKGLVILHHAVANYQDWPEYEKILGGRYYLDKKMVEGVEKPRSIYQHDVDYTIHIADDQHPVTRGLKDFQIHD
jgi:hypothetical protein